MVTPRVLHFSAFIEVPEAETACQKWGGGELGVHELGGNYYIIVFILNTSGIEYYNYL